jgi:hypothetical protein
VPVGASASADSGLPPLPVLLLIVGGLALAGAAAIWTSPGIGDRIASVLRPGEQEAAAGVGQPLRDDPGLGELAGPLALPIEVEPERPAAASRLTLLSTNLSADEVGSTLGARRILPPT